MNRAPFPPIPDETATAAHAIFGRSNFYMSVGDHTSNLFSNLVSFDAPDDLKRSTLTMPRLYLLTIFQFMETLPDGRAADALRERLDWKYGLHLPLHYPGVEAAYLCKFRRWLLTDQAGMQNFQTLTQRVSELSSRTGVEGMKVEAAQILNHLCTLSRIAEVWEAMSRALGALVTKHPEWLRFISLPHWYARYTRYRNHWEEKFEKPDWEEFVQEIGSDGAYLLEAVSRAGKPALEELPEIKTLKQVWQVQYIQFEGRLIWRKESCADCSVHLQI